VIVQHDPRDLSELPWPPRFSLALAAAADACALPIDDPAALPAAASRTLSSSECVCDRCGAIDVQLPSEAPCDRQAQPAGVSAKRVGEP
jgi:hypothetical protein